MIHTVNCKGVQQQQQQTVYVLKSTTKLAFQNDGTKVNAEHGVRRQTSTKGDRS